MATTATQGTPPRGNLSKMTLLYKTDEHSKPSICPRHPPIGRTRYPLVLPPELLISILLDIRSEYLCYLFLSETRDEEEVEERLAANPFPAILHVSQQFRRIAFSIVEAFGAYRDPEGCLPKDAWGCLRHIMKYVHLVQRGTPELVGAHVETGRLYIVPPLLNTTVQNARLMYCAENSLLGELEREMEPRNFGRVDTLQLALEDYTSAVLYSYQFRTMMTVMLLFVHAVQTWGHLLGECLSTQHLMSNLGRRFTGEMMIANLIEPLVQLEEPILLELPRGVNADLLVRFKFLANLWRYQGLPIIDKGPQNMSQALLDACVDISMLHRKSPVLQGSRRRRVSFSEFERIKAIPSPLYLPPCLCETRQRML